MGRATEVQYATISGNWPRYLNRLLNTQKGRKADGLTTEHLMELLEKQGRKCALSNIELTCKLEKGRKFMTNASIDRIEAGGPYSPENVRLTCSGLNMWRGDLETTEFVYFCRKVAEHNPNRRSLPSMAKKATKKKSSGARDYKKEYQRDHSSPTAKKHRAARNKARAEAIKEGKVTKGTKNNRSTQEIDHTVPLSRGGSNSKSNTRVVSRKTNRQKGAKMPASKKATSKKKGK